MSQLFLDTEQTYHMPGGGVEYMCVYKLHVYTHINTHIYRYIYVLIQLTLEQSTYA